MVQSLCRSFPSVCSITVGEIQSYLDSRYETTYLLLVGSIAFSDTNDESVSVFYSDENIYRRKD